MADIIPREFKDLLLARVDIVDFIHTHVPLHKKSSNNYFACCPFHHEKSASFSVSRSKQFYHCFGCGAHGNAIDFCMQYHRLNFPEAISHLAREMGMEVPRTTGTQTKTDDRLPALYELMSALSTYYYEQMRQSQTAIQYLKNRGINGATAQLFLLGYASPGWHQLLDKFGKTEADKKKLLDVGVIIKKEEGGYYDRFRDRIIFPIQDFRGRFIGFGGRILEQGEPKYLNSPETPLFQKGHELYGLYQAQKIHHKLAQVIIVEGYMDVIALFQQGIDYAVATLGTATTTQHLQRLFRYTSDIIFCFDGDNAGRTAAWRALQVMFPLMHDRLQIRFLFLPDGEDPDSLVRKEGKVAFEARYLNALSLSAFFFQTLGKQSDMNALEGRARFASEALTYIKQLPHDIFQGMLLSELSKRASIDLVTLEKQLAKNTTHESIVVAPLVATKIKLPAPLRLALALLVQYPALAKLLTAPLTPTELPGHAFLIELIEYIQTHNLSTSGALLEHWREKKEFSFMTKLAQFEHNVPELGVDNEFLGVLQQVMRLGFESEINRLLQKAAQEGLSDAEKQALSDWIAKKKSPLQLNIAPAEQII
ncbi:MAG TPA: DNA primase [Gammaproteobacteria bacterium]|jgi:DNA primase|nr:DNA primase [Gammaproteobacteria bacterium]